MTDQTPPAPDKLMVQHQIGELMQTALRGGVPQFYANAVGVAQTSSDVSLVLLVNGNPAGILSMSYTTAKTLTTELDKALNNFEKATGVVLRTAQDLDKDLRKIMTNDIGKSS